MSNPREDQPLDIRDGKLHVSYGAGILIQRYRLQCLEQGVIGSIVEDGIEYPMNENAVFHPGPEPFSLADDGRWTSKILNFQMRKRKAAREPMSLQDV